MSKTISPEIAALSEKIASGVSLVDGKVVVDSNTYVQTLPEGITVEQAKALHDHNANFFPAAVKALGPVVLDAMKKDKKIDSLSAEFPMIGKDRFEVTIERKREFPNPADKENPSVIFGNIKASLTTQAARASRGSMSIVKEQLNAEFHAALAK